MQRANRVLLMHSFDMLKDRVCTSSIHYITYAIVAGSWCEFIVQLLLVHAGWRNVVFENVVLYL